MTTKVWKLQTDSVPNFNVKAESVQMVGDETHFVKVSEKGTVIYGPLSIVAGTESIRTGGMFTSLPNMAKMIPSTTVTPIPDQIPVPPIHVAFNLAEDVAFFAMLLM